MKVKLHILERHTAEAFWALSSISLLFVFLYGYFVIGTVFSMSVSENIEQTIRVARSDLSELEHAYIDLSERVRMTEAARLGLVLTRNARTYIKRGSAVTAYIEGGDGF